MSRLQHSSVRQFQSSLVLVSLATAPLGGLEDVLQESVIAPIEPVIRCEAGGSQIFLTVQSHGCTSTKDFMITKIARDINGLHIAVNRVREDYCKGFFPEGEAIRLNINPWRKRPGERVFVGRLSCKDQS